MSGVERSTPPPPRVLVTGARDWRDAAAIRRALSALPPGSTVITGAASGADRLAALVAADLGLGVEEYPADWRRYGRAAGPIRNQWMLDHARSDRVIAFHADLARSRGTADMLRRARRAGLPVTLVAR